MGGTLSFNIFHRNNSIGSPFSVSPKDSSDAPFVNTSNPPVNDEHEDIYDKIENTGCSKEYNALDECVIQFNKDWRKCQIELYAFQECCEHHQVPVASPTSLIIPKKK
ncbi:hypothetical protein IE077_000154 [Cardiosporidium cionae]|uniref:Uncharacterized protein n=1 Tax=Cardiosporidium cionae TaxID=476202 RepID=A0ABQ7JD63_9APIC|nr:hypothetical protein IE077_000154 [Cardiosporidium cionae]|eukprot:KAF8821899.1 hypothetical protein IE077_000154 [Cardiosporidium cionae]